MSAKYCFRADWSHRCRMCKVCASYVWPFHFLLNGVCVETSAKMKEHPTDVPINLLPCLTNNVIASASPLLPITLTHFRFPLLVLFDAFGASTQFVHFFHKHGAKFLREHQLVPFFFVNYELTSPLEARCRQWGRCPTPSSWPPGIPAG